MIAAFRVFSTLQNRLYSSACVYITKPHAADATTKPDKGRASLIDSPPAVPRGEENEEENVEENEEENEDENDEENEDENTKRTS